MKKLALSMVVGGMAAAVAVPALATTTTAPPASLTYARAASTGDAAAPGYARFKARRDLWLKVRADWKKHRKGMWPLKRQARILGLELKILMLREKTDQRAIMAKVKQIADLKGKIMTKRIFFRLAMKKKYPELGRAFGRGWRGHRGFRSGGPCFRRGGGPGWRGHRGYRGRGFRGGPGPMGPMGPRTR
ncbi:MAG: hypothetical protein KKC37_06240 [Proteobacteria bacterium]|nr:hypothetical protein [Pseudomonadota bacterium]